MRNPPPGPIAINSATFVGYRAGGFFGAFLATLGVVLPSFLIILAISCVLRQFQELKPVQYAFQGIRAGVLALIIRAMVSMYRQCPRDLWAYLLMGAAFVCVALLQINAHAGDCGLRGGRTASEPGGGKGERYDLSAFIFYIF